MVEKIITKARDTRSIIDIDGQAIEVAIYGCPDCYPTEIDKKKIMSSLSRGASEGTIYSIQPHKETSIYGRWRKVKLDIKIGSVVEFSTSGKYNPGFHSTERYIGKITGVINGKWMVEVDNVGRALIPSKHIERLI